MIRNPKISVLMSVYNSASYLKESIDSVLSQTFTDFELIIINDGSTDSSWKIINDFKDERIIKIDNDGNKGLIYSLNLGLNLASGTFIARMDSDDICFPNRFQAQFDYLISNPDVAVLGSDYINFSETSEKKCVTLKGKDVLKSWLTFSSPLCHPSVMMRADSIRSLSNAYDTNFRHVEDYELWTRMALNFNLENLPLNLIRYRHHNQQVSQIAREEQYQLSSVIQHRYLSDLGFSFSEEEFNIHRVIASGKKIDRYELLQRVRLWLETLRNQNLNLKVFNVADFDFVLGRVFYDTCGNTSLGLSAFHLWRKSKFKLYYGNNSKMLLRQFIKCMIRRFN
ncbi:MAG: glycosyltransferase [Bacteroidota bacterium]